MEQELYYLIAKFLSAGPCKEAANTLEKELREHRELLPHTITYEGRKVPMTMDRLSREYPDVNNGYLLDLLEKFLGHFKENGDPKILRVNALRHGDNSLLTMLSAFIPHQETQRCNYLTMTKCDLERLPIHRALIARELGCSLMNKNEIPTALSKFYRERVTISGHRGPVYCVAFDKTNRRLFTGSDDYLVKVWCVRTGYLINTIRGHLNVITDIAINQENTLMATASLDGSVRVWTMDEYKPIMCLRQNAAAGMQKAFTTVKFSPSPRSETRYLMATNEDGLVRLWRWDRDTLQFFDADKPITFSCKFRAKDRLRCSSFNYTGTRFTVAGDDGFVYVFSTIPIETTHTAAASSTSDIGASQESTTGRPRGGGNTGAGRGRRKIASALFPDKSGQIQAQPVVPIGTLEGHKGSVTDLAYSHDGQRILSGCQDGTARIWKFDKITKEWSSIELNITKPLDVPIVKPKQQNHTIDTSINQATPPTSSPRNNDNNNEFGSLMPSLDSADNDNAPMQIDENTNNISAQQPMSLLEPPKVSMIAWSSDDRWCFVATTYGEIRVYYAYNGEPACVLKGHEGEVYALDNHPLDPSTILSAGYDGKVILWDVERKNVISCRSHAGRTFTDCKFSKDAMKYAITDEEGHCTLFGIGGLDKDYELVRSWERGQYFASDYQSVTNLLDGSLIDDATQEPPYALPPLPIIDLQGIAYPNQKKLGYGRNIPIVPETFELEDLKRSACYDMEVEETRQMRIINLPIIDRARIAKLRREFVKNDDEDEDNGISGTTQFQFPPPPLQPFLPDDSADEDYHDDGENPAYASSDNSEGGSDDFVTRDDASDNGRDADGNDGDDDEDGPVTRSRAGQLRRQSLSPAARTNNTTRRLNTRGSGSGGASSSGSSNRRGRGGRSTGRGPGRPPSHGTRKRARERSYDEEDLPVRPRARRRTTHVSYLESDLEESEDEEEEDEEEGTLDVDDDSDARFSDGSEAGPSNATIRHHHHHTTATTSAKQSTPEPEDRKGKRRLRQRNSDDDDDDDFVGPSSSSSSHHHKQQSSSSSSSTGRTTRSRSHVPTTNSNNHSNHHNHNTTSNTTASTSTASSSKPTTSAAAAATSSSSSSSSVKPGRRPAKNRNTPRELSNEEIKDYEPIPWIKNCERSLSKYLPQLTDVVAIMSEGHKEYLKQSDMKEFFDDRHGVIDKHEPVIFARVTGIQWVVGPPTFCRLKLALLQLSNLQEALFSDQVEPPQWIPLGREAVIDYTDEDGSPEFIVLWERFQASMDIFRSVTDGERVDAMYDDDKYTGIIDSRNQKGIYWKRANSPSPWAYYHIIWDDKSSPADDLCPWEIVPHGEDFRERYDVEPVLSPQQIERARVIIDWLKQEADFQLYVEQVDYYTYPTYLTMVAYPICLDVVMERLNNNFYRSIEGLIDDVELIRKNAQRYNAATSLAAKNAVRLANFFKTRLTDPKKPIGWEKSGRRETRNVTVSNVGRRRATVTESDDEYHEDHAYKEESDEEPDKFAVRVEREQHFEDEDFIDDDDDDDDYA